jgi:hypothetical protein
MAPVITQGSERLFGTRPPDGTPVPRMRLIGTYTFSDTAPLAGTCEQVGHALSELVRAKVVASELDTV